MTSETEKNHTREEYVYLAKLYERAERFDDMVKFVNKFVELDPKLTHEERNILSAGYKNVISNKRASWRLLNSMEKKEEKKNSTQINYIKEIKTNIENEIRHICKELQSLIDKFLLPNFEDHESEVNFYQLKADYHRYICEFAEGKEYNENFEKSEEYYKKAYNISIKDLPVNNSTRVGLALNYAIFLYEIKGDKKMAFDIAKKTFDESMKFVDDLEKPKYRDTLLIIQLLKENLIFWSSEMNEEEEAKSETKSETKSEK